MKRTLSTVLAVLISACLLSACGGAGPDGAAPEDGAAPAASTSSGRPHVVLITLDTFRPDHLASYGYGQVTGPFLDRLVSEGTVFRSAYSTSSWTAPATSSLFTGLYTNRHGIKEGFLAHQKRSEALEDLVGTSLQLNRLPDALSTLPELLRGAGYQTMGVASNINIGREIGFDRGFDKFRKLQDRDAEVLAEQISAWRAEASEKAPTFLYLHFNDVHEPYEPREQWYEDPPTTEAMQRNGELAPVVAAYNSEISYLDGVLASLYETLAWHDNTLVVVVSDHGEEFGEHGRIGHQFSLYDELMHTMMVFSGPDLGIGTWQRDIHVSLIDVLPTILDLLQVPIPEGRDGLSLLPWLTMEEPPTSLQRDFRRRTLFAHRQRFRVRQGKELQQLWAAVRGPWKLIESDSGARLFHLVKDPAEKRDRASFQEDLVLDLQAELERFRSRGVDFEGQQTEVELDQETLESLRSLGYIQ